MLRDSDFNFHVGTLHAPRIVYFLQNSDPVFHLLRQIHKYVTDFLSTVNEPLEGVYSHMSELKNAVASLAEKKTKTLNCFCAFSTTENLARCKIADFL